MGLKERRGTLTEQEILYIVMKTQGTGAGMGK